MKNKESIIITIVVILIAIFVFVKLTKKRPNSSGQTSSFTPNFLTGKSPVNCEGMTTEEIEQIQSSSNFKCA